MQWKEYAEKKLQRHLYKGALINIQFAIKNELVFCSGKQARASHYYAIYYKAYQIPYLNIATK